MKRSFILKLSLVTLFVILAFVLYSIYSRQPTTIDSIQTAPNTIRVAYNPNSRRSSSVIIAYEKEYFSEEGVNVNLLAYDDIVNNARDAFRLKSVDVAFFGPIGVFDIELSSLDVVSLSPINKIKILKIVKEDNESWIYSLVVGKDSDIISIKDLKGKKIGIHFQELILFFNYTLKNMLKSADLMIDDVIIVKGISLSEVENKIKSGEIDVALTTRYIALAGEAHGSTRTLVEKFYPQYFMNPNIVSLMVIDADFAKSYPEKVQKFRNAIEKAIEFEKKNPEESIRIIRKYNIEIEWDLSSVPSEIWLSPHLADVDVNLLERYQDKLYESGLLTGKVNVSQMII